MSTQGRQGGGRGEGPREGWTEARAETEARRTYRKSEARQAWGGAWTDGVLAQGSARRGASQGCDFLSLGFPQKQLCLVWGLCLEVNRLLLPVLTLFQGSARPTQGSQA